MNTVIILAGGTGTRVGSDIPKQFIEVLGKPVLAYTCDIFQKNKNIDAIEIVCHCDWVDYCWQMVEEYKITKVRWIVLGGKTFQDSVINGVRNLENLLGKETSLQDHVFIQYGGAPFTSQKIVNAVAEMTFERGSAVSATPCYQLLSERETESTSTVWCDRDRYIQIACPYGFRFDYLLNIYKKSEEQGLLEKIEPHTTSLMYALGETINYAYGDQTNIKITTAEDIELFEGFVMAKQKRNAKKDYSDIIVFLADGFEECEGLLAVDILRRAGLSVVMASIMGRKEVFSSRNIMITADCLAENVEYENGRMIVLPGGRIGTHNLAKSNIVKKQCKFFAADKGKYIAAICAAPSLLAEWGLLESKKATCHPDYLKKMNGAIPQNLDVVKEGNIITSQGLGSAFPFAFELVRILTEESEVQRIKETICYRY